MSKAYLNKYENGKSQTIHARERANGGIHQSRLREYLEELDTPPVEHSPVVITVPTAKAKPAAPVAQMMLFDQPVTVKLAEPEPATRPVAAPAPAPAVETPKVQPTPRIIRMAPPMKSARNSAEELTLAGLLKGCGLGLASAAAVLLAYLVIT